MDLVQKTEEDDKKALPMKPVAARNTRKKKKNTKKTKTVKTVKTPFNAIQKEVLDNFQEKLQYYMSIMSWCYEISRNPMYEDISEHLTNTHKLFVMSIKDNDASNYEALLEIAAANEENTMTEVDREVEIVLRDFFEDLVIPSTN